MKIEVKKDKNAHNKFAFKAEFTEGQILAIANALKLHADTNHSPVAADVLFAVWAAGEKAGITFDK